MTRIYYLIQEKWRAKGKEKLPKITPSEKGLSRANER